jgi:DNA modification methylase/superfamily II DNA or RNA helicase
MNAYEDFLRAKVIATPDAGFECSAVNSQLFPFQREIVRWALRKGRAAIFADCGLGKSGMQLEWCKRVAEHTGGEVLCLTTLAVTSQMQREAEKFGVDARVIRSDADAHAPVVIANYEILHKLNPQRYAGISLDESSVLKAYSGKTKRMLVEAFKATPYRLCNTATPAPNDHQELGNHCEFLGIMTSHKMLARWFVNDTMQAGVWRLKGHAARDFWRWVASWAVSASRPSDIGEHSDDGYVLPPLDIVQHTVGVDIVSGRQEGQLFREPTLSATQLHKELRLTAPQRAAKVAELVASTPGPWVVWCNTNYEADEITARIPEAVEVRGDDKLEAKEARVAAFLSGEVRVLLSKPTVLGFGLNFQHVSNMAFVGLSYSYEQFYQALRRSYRFGQKSPVTAHVIGASTEGAIADVVRAKQQEHSKMKEQMTAAAREVRLDERNGLDTALIAENLVVERDEWTLRLGDCVEETRKLPDELAGFVIYSPPFSNLYTYSDSYRDMGNSEDDAQFMAHFGFLLPELRRVTKAGRLMAVHVKQVVNYIGRDGASGLRDFRGDIIRECQRAGWVYHSEVCIWKDPVIEMQRTKSHGLLYKQLRRDSSYSRQGLAEYLLVFRKWGAVDAPVDPVVKTEDGFPLEMWQRYASPVWFDINQTRVLNVKAARDNADEKHICPLQLDVIERAVKLWSNPGDVVFSPFAGIGSEGYESLRMRRRFVGVELKRSYFDQAVRNLTEAVETRDRQGDLFATQSEEGGAIHG